MGLRRVEFLIPPSPRRHTGHALECAAEDRFGLVADIACDAGDTVLSAAQPVGRELDAPARHIFNGWLAEERIETLGQHGAGGAGLTCEVLRRRAPRRGGVHEL